MESSKGGRDLQWPRPLRPGKVGLDASLSVIDVLYMNLDRHDIQKRSAQHLHYLQMCWIECRQISDIGEIVGDKENNAGQ